MFELVFFTLFARHLKMNLMVKKDCSLSRVLFLLFFLSFSFSLEPATRRRLITNNCSFPVTSCASVLPLHSLSLSLASEHNSRLFVVLRINTILLSSCFFSLAATVVDVVCGLRFEESAARADSFLQ